jgi:hypothetical protein
MRKIGYRDNHTTVSSVGAARGVLAAVMAAGLVFGIALGPIAPPAVGATSHCARKSSPASLSVAVTRARSALDAAVTSVHHRNHARAVDRLRAVKRQVRTAHTKATFLIGKPPTDPESDEPPGPNAVLKVAGLEHQVTMKLVPLFDGLRGRAVHALGSALNRADTCRHVMLGKVIALRPGARDDYTDGLADTLPDYNKELKILSTALRSHDLADAARTDLRHVRKVVTATRHDMQRAFGGGE